MRTKRERDFAAILENWNPAEFKPVEPGAYDGDVAPILAIFETKPTNKDRTQDLRQYLRLTHKVEPKNLDGMHIYLRNWVTLNK